MQQKTKTTTFREIEQTPSLSKLLTLEQLAERLTVKKSWLYQRTRVNSIPCIRLGRHIRFNEQEVSRWLQDQQ